jgi:hypothetical protein
VSSRIPYSAACSAHSIACSYSRCCSTCRYARLIAAAAWETLSPGGRVVGVVPNADCPIVQRARSRFSDNYTPPTLAELAGILASLAGVEHWAMRGLRFGADQRIAPYDVSPWTSTLVRDGGAAPPNRLLFLLFTAFKQSPPELT